MAQREVSWEELVRAGTVIFGPGFAQAVHGPGWRANLRAAWRQRVLETHPDRAAVLGQSEAVLQQRFRAVSEAFSLLESFALGSRAPPTPRASSVAASPLRTTRGSPPPRGASPRPPSPPRTPPPHGPPPRPPTPISPSADVAGPRLPRRRLRFAEFLYYSGRVAWQDYVAALTWQRNQRPQIGRLAIDLGLLDSNDITELLMQRRREGAQGEPIGQFAVRRGYLTRAQLLGLVGRQAKDQQRIGQYFLEQRLLTAAQLEGAQLALFGHNARYAVKVA